MIRRSPVVNINSNLRRTPMRISKFLSELSMMDDDSEKIMKLNDFICSLEDELNRIFRFQHQFPFSVLFLKEAIDKFKDVKRVFEVHAVSKILNSCKTVLDEDTKSNEILVNANENDRLNSAKHWTTTAHINNRDVINIESDDEEVNNTSAPSIHGSIYASSAPAIQSQTIGFDPREKRVRNSFGTPSVMIGQEPPTKRGRISWPVELYKRFQHVVNTLGGPTVATPKEIKDRMQVAEITEDEIIHHLMKYRLDISRRPHGHSPLFLHATHSMVGQDAPKTSGNRIQSGSQQTPIRIGESSSGQMAAAAGNNTNGGWNLICSAPNQDVLKMRGMPVVQSGYPETPFFAGESSNRQMLAAAPHNGNGGEKLVGHPCIHAMDNRM